MEIYCNRWKTFLEIFLTLPPNTKISKRLSAEPIPLIPSIYLPTKTYYLIEIKGLRFYN